MPNGSVMVCSEFLFASLQFVAAVRLALEPTHLALVGLFAPTSNVVFVDERFGRAVELSFLECRQPLLVPLQGGLLALGPRSGLARRVLHLAGQPRQAERHQPSAKVSRLSAAPETLETFGCSRSAISTASSL